MAAILAALVRSAEGSHTHLYIHGGHFTHYSLKDQRSTHLS